jgi:hypothetical protein
MNIFYLASNSISIPRSANDTMLRFVISFFLIISSLAGATEFRIWSNADKTKTFEAEYVGNKDDRVTMRLKNLKIITMEMNKLHIDDQAWIQQNHPTENDGVAHTHIKKIDEDAIFDTVVFGDNRDTVTKKLYESKLVTATMDPTFIGRTGLNNVFVTRDKIGGLNYSLTFNWSPEGKLIECTLQTEDRNIGDYSSDLEKSWQELGKILISIYGKPKRFSKMPKASDLQESQTLTSHSWRLNQGGSILLGSAKMDGRYQVVVRFTKEIL